MKAIKAIFKRITPLTAIIICVALVACGATGWAMAKYITTAVGSITNAPINSWTNSFSHWNPQTGTAVECFEGVDTAFNYNFTSAAYTFRTVSNSNVKSRLSLRVQTTNPLPSGEYIALEGVAGSQQPGNGSNKTFTFSNIDTLGTGSQTRVWTVRFTGSGSNKAYDLGKVTVYAIFESIAD